MTIPPHHLIIENVNLSFGSRQVLRDLNFVVPIGSSLAIVGPNGAGKSTLFKAIVGLLPVDSGRILIHDRPIHTHKDCVAYVPQKEEVDWKFPVTVHDVIMMGRYNTRGWFARPNKSDRKIVDQCLEELNIERIGNVSINELSGGQQQRVFLARAIAQEPHILLMDEPFTGIDTPTQEITFSLIERLLARKVTVVISTHDLNLASTRFHQALLMNKSVIAHGKPAEVFTPQNMSNAFGNSILMLENGSLIVDECCPPDEEHNHLHTH
jgi:ABC-type Mn2+/Zn2+ transport system ATPase subunit